MKQGRVPSVKQLDKREQPGTKRWLKRAAARAIRRQRGVPLRGFKGYSG
jgi:hypothetical protein